MDDKLIIDEDLLKEQAEKLGVALLPQQIRQLGDFCAVLSRFNEHTNLVSNCQADVLLRDHVLDSLSLVPSIKPSENLSEKTSLIDIGSGGGFPGLVLAIVMAKLKVALVESVTKKARFLSEAITALSLNERLSVLNSRAELIAHDRIYRHQFEYVTCRALGSLPTVLELSLPFLVRGGLAMIQRSALQARQESEQADKVAGKLGAGFTGVVYPSEDALAKQRAILLFEQKALSPKIYPRTWPKPKQSPLC